MEPITELGENLAGGRLLCCPCRRVAALWTACAIGVRIQHIGSMCWMPRRAR
jgi:hypothetical protein